MGVGCVDLWWVCKVCVCVCVCVGGGGIGDGLWVWGVRICGGSVRFVGVLEMVCGVGCEVLCGVCKVCGEYSGRFRGGILEMVCGCGV